MCLATRWESISASKPGGRGYSDRPQYAQAPGDDLPAGLPRPETLHQDAPLRWWWIGIWTLIGAAAGALVIATITGAAWQRINWLGIVILETSGAVIGGYIGFMLCRLITSFRRAVAEAHSLDARRRARKNWLFRP